MKLAQRCLLCQQWLLKTDFRNIAAGNSREKYLAKSKLSSDVSSCTSIMSLHARRNVEHPPFSKNAKNGSPAIDTRGLIFPEVAEHTKPKSISFRTGPNVRPENSFVNCR